MSERAVAAAVATATARGAAAAVGLADASLSAAQFRIMFPAFSDPAAYPDATIEFWIGLAPCDPDIWNGYYQLGQGLWAAHEMMKFGSVPGSGGPGASGIGPMTSKSVGPVSVGYDANVGSEDGAGSYNSTIYGRQFYHWAKLLGMGPIQVGAVTVPPYGTGSTWLGPPPIPGWFA
jgi:hypothetical protein